MRLLVILTLGLGVCGPTLIDAEKIVFVVPRYVRRSGPSPFYAQHGYKTRPSILGPKRPYFGGHYSATSSEPFFPDEKPRVPQGGDFDQGYFNTKEEVNHVIIPHGKGISHGISFGKGYLPRDPFKESNGNYEFLGGSGNNQLEYAGHNHQDVKFEDDSYSRFQNQEQATPAVDSNTDWAFAAHQTSYTPMNYDQETNQEESGGHQHQEGYRSQTPKEEVLFQKSTGGEEQRGVLEENAPSARVSGIVMPEGNPGRTVVVERKLEPIILRDTVDMKEYVEKFEAFTKSWPSAAALHGFGWKNQILNPPSLTLPNYQGFNSWTTGLNRPPSGSYQVQEDSVEEPSQRSYRTVMM